MSTIRGRVVGLQHRIDSKNSQHAEKNIWEGNSERQTGYPAIPSSAKKSKKERPREGLISCGEHPIVDAEKRKCKNLLLKRKKGEIKFWVETPKKEKVGQNRP